MRSVSRLNKLSPLYLCAYITLHLHLGRVSGYLHTGLFDFIFEADVRGGEGSRGLDASDIGGLNDCVRSF